MRFFFIITFISLFYLSFVWTEQVYEYDGYKYLFSVPFKGTWFKAYNFCRYRGMFLIDVPHDNEQQRLVRLIATLDPPYNNTFFWTSGTDLDNEGEFIWMSSGHQFLYTNWNTVANPSNTYHDEYNETENCVELRFDTAYNWNDHACHHENYFICRNTTISPFLIPTNRISP